MISRASVLSLLTVGYGFAVAPALAEKNPEDPTKIVTRAGVSYDGEFGLSGSIGLDESRMINARVKSTGDEWRIGGSWLFPVGIVNFNFSRSEFDDEAFKNNYSIGTFIPLSYFGIEPAGWQLFPMAGYSYNDGEFAVHDNDSVDEQYVLMPASSHGGYIGLFGLKPLANDFTLMAFGGGSAGSENYTGYWYGMGLSYKITSAQSVNVYGVQTDDDFGSEGKVGVSYTYEFD